MTATPEAKKTIIAQLIERIDVSDGYEVNIRFRMVWLLTRESGVIR